MNPLAVSGWWAEHARGIYYLSSVAIGKKLRKQCLCAEVVGTAKPLKRLDVVVAFLELKVAASTCGR